MHTSDAEIKAVLCLEATACGNVPIIPTVILNSKSHGIYKYIKTKPLITLEILESIYSDLLIENKFERIEKFKNRHIIG